MWDCKNRDAYKAQVGAVWVLAVLRDTCPDALGTAQELLVEIKRDCLCC